VPESRLQSTKRAEEQMRNKRTNQEEARKQGGGGVVFRSFVSFSGCCCFRLPTCSLRCGAQTAHLLCCLLLLTHALHSSTTTGQNLAPNVEPSPTYSQFVGCCCLMGRGYIKREKKKPIPATLVRRCLAVHVWLCVLACPVALHVPLVTRCIPSLVVDLAAPHNRVDHTHTHTHTQNSVRAAAIPPSAMAPPSSLL
jgi:hypothetical protein